MSLFSPPKAPTPEAGLAAGQKVAQGQQTYNTQAGQESQAGSMVGQENPYGSLSYSQTGTSSNGTPLYTAKTSLTPEQQSMFDTLQGTKGLSGVMANKLFANSGYGDQDPRKAIGDMTSGITGGLMTKQMEYMQPFFKTERDQLDTQLRNQGLAPGMPGYDNALRQLDTNHSLATSKAAADFEGQAFGQANTLYDKPRVVGEDLANFGAPGDPKSGFVNTPGLNVQPANLTGAVSAENQMLNDQYKAKNEQYSAMMTGLMKIPTAVLGGWASGGLSGLGGLGGLLGGGANAPLNLAPNSGLGGLY